MLNILWGIFYFFAAVIGSVAVYVWFHKSTEIKDLKSILIGAVVIAIALSLIYA
jgi:hypothetical protein